MARKKLDFETFKAQFEPTLFDEYEVTLHLRDCAGGTPMSKDLIKGWIDATCKEKSEEERAKIVEATLETLPEVSDEKEARSWVGFKRDENGHLFIDGRCAKAMLKEAANILRELVPNGGRQVGKNKGKNRGVTAFKSKLADHVFVVEERIYFLRDGKRISAPDELEERPVHAMTPQGPRSSLKRSDILRDVTVNFTVRRLHDQAVPEEALMACLVYAQHLGLGSDRSQGKGTMLGVTCERVKDAVEPEKKDAA